jgi:carboxymethylenebutenolidase
MPEPPDTHANARSRAKPRANQPQTRHAPHGFHAAYQSSYREEQAKDGWQKLIAWFREHGVK